MQPARRCPFAQASPSPRTKECSPATCPVPLTTPNERRSRACSPAQAPPTPAGTRVVANLARARRQSRETHPAPGPANAAALPWREAMARFERHGSELAARPDVAWGPTADPQGSCGTRPGGGDGSWRCSTAQLRVAVRPGGSGCATQGEPRGPSSALRTVLTAADPRDQSNAEPPLTPSPQRVPRVAHAALGCAILAQGESSRSTGRHAREPPLLQAVVVVSSDGSTQM